MNEGLVKRGELLQMEVLRWGDCWRTCPAPPHLCLILLQPFGAIERRGITCGRNRKHRFEGFTAVETRGLMRSGTWMFR